MSWRLRRSVRILPGVRLNFSRSGVSTSIGGRGATINIGKRGVRTTIGLPGTGVSWSEASYHHSPQSVRPATTDDRSTPLSAGGCGGPVLAVAVVLAVVVLARSHSEAEPGGIKVQPAAVQTLAVMPRKLNCRTSPSTTAPALEVLLRNEQAEVVGTEDGWAKLYRSGTYCWVRRHYLAAAQR